MNKTVINATYEDRVTGNDKISSYFCFLVPTLTGIPVVLNFVFSIVCFKSLRNNFHNMVVLSLCITDSFVGLAFIWFALSRCVLSSLQSWSCLFTICPPVFALLLSYFLVLLLCLERYLVVKSYNFGTKEKLDKLKFKLIGGVSSLALFFSVVLCFIPHNASMATCTASHLYKNYIYFVLIVPGTLSILLLLITLIALLTAYHVWKKFFKSKNKIVPQNCDLLVQNRTFDKNNVPESPDHLTEHQQTSSTTVEVDCIEIDLTDTKINKIKLHDIFVTETPSQESSAGTKCIKEGNRQKCRLAHNERESNASNTHGEHQNCSHRNSRKSLHDSKSVQHYWEVRAFITCVIIATSTLVFTGPFVVSFWNDIISDSMIPFETRSFIFILCTVNSLINPFIYAWRISEIRMSFKALCRKS